MMFEAALDVPADSLMNLQLSQRENIIRELQKQAAQTGTVLSAKLEEVESGTGECTPPKKGISWI